MRSTQKIQVVGLSLVLMLSLGVLFGQEQTALFSNNIAQTEKLHTSGRFTSVKQLTAASPDFNVGFYRCEWRIDPAVRFIEGKITSRFTITATTGKIVFDLSDTLTVDSILIHGSKTSFARPGGDALEIQLPAVMNAGKTDSLSIFYRGTPRVVSSFVPFVRSTHSGSPIIWTLSEPFGAKEWWPCRNGLDDKADSIDIIITTPTSYRSSSNGIPMTDDTAGGMRTQYFKSRYPIASYLVALAVTNYVVFRDSVVAAGQQIPLMLSTYPEFAANAGRIFNNTKYSMLLISKYFGNYPFSNELYGQTAFHAGGGMEHQTNSFITTTDVNLIVHELGHQWFGDKITCGSWKDIWLNEGFATYCQWLYYQDTLKNIRGAYGASMKANFYPQLTSVPGGSVKVDDTTNAGRIFSSRLSYNKGAFLLQTLRWKIGDSSFFKGVRRYLNDPALKYSFALTADLKGNLELESGKDLAAFFTKWYEGEGYPIYSINWTQDSSNFVYLKLAQTTSHPSVSFYDLPVPVQFKNASRDTILVLNHTQPSQEFLVNPGFQADTVIFDPDAWILALSDSKKTACALLAAQDSILPNYTVRWSQNRNGWIAANIEQTNHKVVGTTLPFYIHFSSGTRDTSILIDPSRQAYRLDLKPGFSPAAATVTGPCFAVSAAKVIQEETTAGDNVVSIYPVPATRDYLTISVKNPTDPTISVILYNITGQVLFRTSVATNGADVISSIPVAPLPHGAYILRLSGQRINLTRKFSR